MGFALASDKTEGPSTVFSFLAILIDMEAMECRLPEAKLVDSAQQGHKITLRQLQSLLGKLNFACRIMPMDRVFNRQLALAKAGLRAPAHHVQLILEHEDLLVFEQFLDTYNGRSVWMEGVINIREDFYFADATG